MQGMVSAAYESGLNQMIVRKILDHFGKAKNRTEEFLRETGRIAEQGSLISLE